MFVQENVRLLSIVIPNGAGQGTTYKFPLDNELTGKKFTAVESFNTTQLNSRDNVQVLSAAESAGITVYLYHKSTLKWYGVPYASLNTQANNGIIRQAANMPFIIEKSYVEVTAPGVLPAADRAAVIAFHYADPKGGK